MNPRRKPICALAPVGRLRPRLFVEHAVALVITGRPDDAEPLLREAERAAEVDGEDGRFLLGFASTVLSWRVHLRGNAPEAVELARRALSLLPEGDVHVRNYAAVRLGDALGSVGDLAAADEAYAEAAEIGRAPRLREARGHGDARQGAG
jgi:ATP/maltotriose-dependent transcriptional regulator MalT